MSIAAAEAIKDVLVGIHTELFRRLHNRREGVHRLGTRLFNFATVPSYWAGTEPEQGELRDEEGSSYMWRRPPPDRFLPFARKHGTTLKGHPLLWHEHNPTWLPKDPVRLRKLYQKRFREIAEPDRSRFAGL